MVELKDLSRYIGTKIINAVEMKLGKYNFYRGWEIPKNEDPEREGYLVVYPDGYESWSPKEAFDEAYRRTDNMNFGLALEALKKGFKVARSGWNGKDMFLWLQEGSQVTEEEARNTILQDCFVDRGGKITLLPHIDMKTVGGEALIGWLASQTDMLSDDWFIVD